MKPRKPAIPFGGFNPELLTRDFDWSEALVPTGAAVPTRIAVSDPNRIAIVFVAATGTTYGISPINKNLATGGFRLTALGQRLEFFYQNWGGMVGSDWYGQTVGAANVWVLSLTYKPKRV